MMFFHLSTSIILILTGFKPSVALTQSDRSDQNNGSVLPPGAVSLLPPVRSSLAPSVVLAAVPSPVANPTKELTPTPTLRPEADQTIKPTLNPNPVQTQTPTPKPVVQTVAPISPADNTAFVHINADPHLKNFSSFAKTMASLLKDKGATLTVLAPENKAFEKVDASFLARLQKPEWAPHMKAVAQLHVVKGKKMVSATLKQDEKVATVNSEKWTIDLIHNGDMITFEALDTKAGAIKRDISVVNGVVHVVNTLLIPRMLTFNVFQASDLMLETFSVFTSHLVKTGLDVRLKNENEFFTLLAPTNDAFRKMFSEIFSAWRDDPDSAIPLLEYHILPGVHPTNLMKTGQMQTIGGRTISVSNTKNVVFNGNVRIEKKSIKLKNGMVFKPANIASKNGLLHAIDSVILPKDNDAPTAAPTNTRNPTGSPTMEPTGGRAASLSRKGGSATTGNTPQTTERPSTILGAVQADGSCWTMSAVLEMAQFNDMPLKNNKVLDVTLLAPTDQAFKSFDAQTLARYLQPDWIVHLRELLSMHMLPSAKGKEAFTDGAVLSTMSAVGETITVSSDNNGITLTTQANSSIHVEEFNLFRGNGTVHVLGGVLLPQNFGSDVLDLVKGLSRFSTLATLLVRAELEDMVRDKSKIQTLVAPTNSAFGELSSARMSTLETETDILRETLLLHIWPGKVYPSELLTIGQKITTAATNKGIQITRGLLNKLKMDADIPASNGLIHAVPFVLSV